MKFECLPTLPLPVFVQEASHFRPVLGMFLEPWRRPLPRSHSSAWQASCGTCAWSCVWCNGDTTFIQWKASISISGRKHRRRTVSHVRSPDLAILFVNLLNFSDCDMLWLWPFLYYECLLAYWILSTSCKETGSKIGVTKVSWLKRWLSELYPYISHMPVSVIPFLLTGKIPRVCPELMKRYEYENSVNIWNSKDFPWQNEHSRGLAGWHGRCKSLWLGCIAEHFFGIIDFRFLVSFDFSILWYFIHLPDYELMLRPKMCWWSFKTSCSCRSRCCSIALT